VIVIWRPWLLPLTRISHPVPKRRRPARSIFDGFRDFQTETSEFPHCLLFFSIFLKGKFKDCHCLPRFHVCQRLAYTSSKIIL
jgi:hypothetical protein